MAGPGLVGIGLVLTSLAAIAVGRYWPRVRELCRHTATALLYLGIAITFLPLALLAFIIFLALTSLLLIPLILFRRFRRAYFNTIASILRAPYTLVNRCLPPPTPPAFEPSAYYSPTTFDPVITIGYRWNERRARFEPVVLRLPSNALWLITGRSADAAGLAIALQYYATGVPVFALLSPEYLDALEQHLPNAQVLVLGGDSHAPLHPPTTALANLHAFLVAAALTDAFYLTHHDYRSLATAFQPVFALHLSGFDELLAAVTPSDGGAIAGIRWAEIHRILEATKPVFTAGDPVPTDATGFTAVALPPLTDQSVWLVAEVLTLLPIIYQRMLHGDRSPLVVLLRHTPHRPSVGVLEEVVERLVALGCTVVLTAETAEEVPSCLRERATVHVLLPNAVPPTIEVRRSFGAEVRPGFAAVRSPEGEQHVVLPIPRWLQPDGSLALHRVAEQRLRAIGSLPLALNVLRQVATGADRRVLEDRFGAEINELLANLATAGFLRVHLHRGRERLEITPLAEIILKGVSS